MVYAKFTRTLTNVTTKAVTQWDYGRTLRIDGLELPTAVRIDFCISGDQTTVSRIGITIDRVTDVVIPDSFLEQSNNLVAYVYVNDTTEGKTVRTINIPVNARAKPEEYDTPESKELFAEAIELINDVAVRAENAESSAKSHADSAKESLEATEQIAEAFHDTATAAVNAVNSAGAAQVQAISEKGAEAVTAAEQAGTSAVADVEAKKQESIAAVKAEGESQLQAITEETARIVADREQINSNTRNKAGAIVLDAEGESIVLNDASEYPLMGLKLFGKSTQDGTPTPEYPQEINSAESPNVTVCGKNLFDMSTFTLTSSGDDGLLPNISRVDSNLIVVTTPPGYTGNGYCNSRTLLKNFCPSLQVGKTYILSGYSERHSFIIHLLRGNVTWANGQSITLTQEMLDSDVVVYGFSTELGDSTGDCVISNIQIEEGAIVTDFEPYKEPQTITIPRTLPGIPVASGGNYTDANGQQWICDEVDLARGVYVQRIVKMVLTGAEANWTENGVATEVGVVAYQLYNSMFGASPAYCFCSHFPNGGVWATNLSAGTNLVWVASGVVIVFKTDGKQTLTDFKSWLTEQNEDGTPVTMYYLLATPIETPLSDAEITAFKALHSNKPNTTILNDAGAFMAVEYVADTKTYIDNKIAEALKGSEQA